MSHPDPSFDPTDPIKKPRSNKMANALREEWNKQQKYLKLNDNEKFNGTFVKWEKITTKFGKLGFRFTLERQDGSRVDWDTSNGSVIGQISDLIDKGLVKGSPIQIVRHGVTKDDTTYQITEEVPF